MQLVRHSLYNLIGLGLPLVVAVFCIPILIRELGEARFGLLTLVWAVVSYFGLFDLGLGRALTQQLSLAIAENDRQRVGPLVATATSLMAGLGLFAGLLMALLAPWGVGLIQAVPDQQEAVNALLLMAIAMPAIVLTSGFRGVLEARHAFGKVNAIRLPMGLLTFLGPVVVVLYGSTRLDVVTAVLAAGRIVACAVHAWFAFRELQDDHGGYAFRRKLLRPLCVSGGWLTLSNIISPLMGYIDRFIIGGTVSAVAVAYYTTPLEVVTKLWIVPGALTAVLFPIFAAQSANGVDQSRELFGKAVCWIYLTLLPIIVFIALFAYEILSAWVGEEFADNSFVLLQIFSFGIFLNCLAHIPFTLIQGSGAARATALIHAAELPFFLALLWWLTNAYGPTGAAIAWLMRSALDALLMFLVCSYLQRWPISRLFNIWTVGLSLIFITTFSGLVVEQASIRIAFFILAVIASAIILALQLPPSSLAKFGRKRVR